jgi:hypothetical protein
MSHIEKPPESTITTIAPNGNHAGMEIWPSREWSEWLYDSANIALIVALVIGAFATVMIVWMGNKKEEYLKKDVAAAQLRGDEAIAKSESDRLERVKIEQEMLKQLRPRGFTKEQYDAFVSSIVYTLTDDEASRFGYAIMGALQKADIKVNWMRPTVPTDSFMVMGTPTTGVILYMPKVGDDLGKKKLVEAFFDAAKSGGVPRVAATMPETPIPGIPAPSLFIAKQQRPFTWFPEYLAPSGLPRPPWEPK